MKLSTAGKVLGPQSGKWEVVYDGDSMPMIKSPGGRLLRLQEFKYGRWEQSALEPADSEYFVEAVNLLRDKNAAEQAARDQLNSDD